MTISRSEDVLVGLITAGLVPWILWTLRRGLRSGALPIGRGFVRRDERPGPFRAMMIFYVAAALLAAFIALDLLTGPEGRSWL